MRLIWSYTPGLGTSHIMSNQRGPGREWENRAVKSDCIKAASSTRATDTRKATGNSIVNILATRSHSLIERKALEVKLTMCYNDNNFPHGTATSPRGYGSLTHIWMPEDYGWTLGTGRIDFLDTTPHLPGGRWVAGLFGAVGPFGRSP